MPPRQTNRISSKRPYLYVVGIICPPRSRFWLLYIYTYKRDTRVFPLRGFFSKFSIVSQSSLSKFCTRHEALWKVSTRIFRAKIVPIKLSLILAIRFALPKGEIVSKSRLDRAFRYAAAYVRVNWNPQSPDTLLRDT